MADTVAAHHGAAVDAAAAHAEDKLAAAVGAAQPAPEATEDEALDLMFGKKKKKGKKATKTFEEGDEGAGTAAVAAVEVSSGSAAGTSATTTATPTASSISADSVATYDEMLTRIFDVLRRNNPELADRRKKVLRPPEVMRVGTTRTAWVNFKDNCASIKRTQEHVMQFFLAEMGTTGALDGMERLLVRGRWPPKQMEALLKKYITEYVICSMCKSMDTDLTRDPVTRLFFVSCKACGSQRSVTTIKAGFHATIKGERKKARNATG